MKILMLSWEYPPHVIGGLGRHVYHLSRKLADKGAEVYVLTLTDGASPAKEDFNGVKVMRVNPYILRYPDFTSWIQGMNMLMLEEATGLDFDIVHAHDWLTATSGIALKHMARKPLIATIHSTEIGRRSYLKSESERHIHELEWWLTYEVWSVICCSQRMAWEVSTYLGCPRDKIVVIPNGYDPNAIPSEVSLDRSRYAADYEKIVLYVGRLVYEKGPHVLIEAASILRRDDLKYVLVGEGPMKPYLLDLARRLGIYEKVYLLGHVPDAELWGLYKLASVAVFPSLYEPFGMVALEAMGAGVPVIVSSVGGFNEIIQDGHNGLTVPPGNPRALASAIARLIDGRALSDQLVSNAKSSLKKFSWEDIAERTIGVYKKVLTEYEKSPWATL